MEDKLKILFVEDVKLDAELNWREIEKNGIVFKKLLVDNRKDFLEGLESFKPDIIISDYSMPQFDGMQALLLRNELAPQTPFIVVTGSVNEEVAVECMKAGADDYVIKEHLTRLPFAIKEALEQHTILIEKRAAELLLKENEEKFKALFQNSNDAIMLMNKNGFFDCNPQTLKIFKVNTKEEFIRIRPAKLSPPVQANGKNSSEATQENISIAYRDGHNRFDWIHRRTDNEAFYAEVLLSAFEFGGGPVLQVTVRDITERKMI